MKRLIPHLLLLITSVLLHSFIAADLYAQETDIVPYLKKIESGNIEEAKEDLVKLKEKHPEDPSVMFLDGVLTENGQQAVVIYQIIVENYPQSKYADAALYRIYSYYYALGLYESAKEKLQLLKEKYPSSPYIKVAEQNTSSDNQLNTANDVTEENEEQTGQTVPEVKYQFTIQAGAFAKIENAQNLKEELQASGILAHIGDKNVGGTTFHIVYAGQFVSYEDAENFLEVLNIKFNLTSRVVPISW